MDKMDHTSCKNHLNRERGQRYYTFISNQSSIEARVFAAYPAKYILNYKRMT